LTLIYIRYKLKSKAAEVLYGDNISYGHLIIMFSSKSLAFCNYDTVCCGRGKKVITLSSAMADGRGKCPDVASG